MRERGARVLGPYPEPNGCWRVITRRPGGHRESQILPTREEALAVVEAARATAESIGRAVSGAIDEYERHLVAKGNKPKSYNETLRRLRLFFAEQTMLLEDLTQTRCKAYYGALVPKYRPDSHRNILLEARSFLRWCCEEKRWLRRNPLAGVQGQGKRSHGKPQLRIDEARLWEAHALALAPKEPGALAALMALYMDMRASEIVGLRVRDVDDQGRVIWIARETTKTDAGRRCLETPKEPAAFRCALLALASERSGEEPLFGKHWRDWPARWAKRISAAVGAPPVCAHGLRGTHATLAMARGTTAEDVARALGHESPTTTVESYARPEAVAAGKQKRTMRVLRGGTK